MAAGLEVLVAWNCRAITRRGQADPSDRSSAVEYTSDATFSSLVHVGHHDRNDGPVVWTSR